MIFAREGNEVREEVDGESAIMMRRNQGIRFDIFIMREKERKICFSPTQA